jgi:uncharacterized protein YjhX (UPF0386 family)
MVLRTFNPDQVKKVILFGGNSNGCCYVIRLFDEKNNQIAQIGHNTAVGKLIEFELQDNERIVGVVCHNNGDDGYVYDLQFVICKKTYTTNFGNAAQARPDPIRRRPCEECLLF